MYFTWSQSMRIAFRFDGLTVRAEALLKFRQDFKQYSEVKNSAYLLIICWCGLKSNQTNYKMNLRIVWRELCRKLFILRFLEDISGATSSTFGDVCSGFWNKGGSLAWVLRRLHAMRHLQNFLAASMAIQSLFCILFQAYLEGQHWILIQESNKINCRTKSSCV